MADGGIINTIKDFFNISGGVGDLRKYDTIVNLGADQKTPGNTVLYVGAEGKGDIKSIETEALKKQQLNIGSSTLKTADLSVGAIDAAQTKAARAGAEAIMNNYSVLVKDGRLEASFPFNPEKPETAKPKDLPGIQAMLSNIRGDLINSGAPEYTYDKEGRVDSETFKSKDEQKRIQQGIAEVEKALASVDRAIALPQYSADLKSDVKSTDLLNAEQKAQVTAVLDAAPSTAGGSSPVTPKR